MKLAIEANDTYRPLWQSRKRYIISIGGRGGARSYEASQNIGAKLLQTKQLFRAATMRAVHMDIRHSIWQEVHDRYCTPECREWSGDTGQQQVVTAARQVH